MKHRRKFAPRHAAAPHAGLSRLRAPFACCALAACALFALPALAAQTAKPSPAVPQKSAPAQTHASLADQPPTAATVSFQHGKLTVKAHNSTLLQILQSIAARTGMKVQGIPGNHRIFGTYGPGEPREIISQLLSGFDFNYLLVGTGPNGAPHKLILAGEAPTGPAPAPPVRSVQPAPQNTAPQPAPAPRPVYPQRHNPPSPRAQHRSGSPRKAQGHHRVRTPQEILKEIEAMHAKQKKSSSH